MIDVVVTSSPAAATVAEALSRARQRHAGVVEAGRGRFVLRDDLARASVLGLERLAARRLARPLPVVAAGAREVAVRRQLAAGAPAVVVRGGRGPLGAIGTGSVGSAVGTSLGQRVLAPLPEATRRLIALVGRAAAARGARAFLAGGLVRDLVAGGGVTARDVDVVIEGDGLAVARELAAALRVPPRALTEHQRFLTASLDVPDAGRIDVATARAERYEMPGALPRVVPAPMREDLVRRDFTINAMAIELAGDDLVLLDPFGGRTDLERRWLRVLHPLSFVEDPTRIFRAARYAARLGFRLEPWTAAARRLALGLGGYPALSGQRILAELDLIVADGRPTAALRELGAAGAFRLLDRRWRPTRRTAVWVARLPGAWTWIERHGLRATRTELASLVLLADQPPAVAAAALTRLGLVGEPLERLRRALAVPWSKGAGAVGGPPSARARALRSRSDLELAWHWLTTPAVRETLTWYAAEGRRVRAELRGDEIAALGVPAGPALAAAVAALRDARLDGVVVDRDGEAAYVRHWIDARKEG